MVFEVVFEQCSGQSFDDGKLTQSLSDEGDCSCGLSTKLLPDSDQDRGCSTVKKLSFFLILFMLLFSGNILYVDSKNFEIYASAQLDIPAQKGFRCLGIDYVSRGENGWLLLIVVKAADGSANSYSATIRPEST